MRTTRQMSVTLPTRMADAVRARVCSGEYASESEVVRDGLRALASQERAVEAWLTDPVARDYAAWEAGTLKTIPLENVVAELRRRSAAD